MTPEERAAAIVDNLPKDPRGAFDTNAYDLEKAIADAIRAAVEEALRERPAR